MEAKADSHMINEFKPEKWRGSVVSIVDAPIDKVWNLVSSTRRLHEWMPMVETCTDLSGLESIPGYVRLVSGFMFPQKDGDRSWIKERLVRIDPPSHCYTYRMESSNIGLDGCTNMLKLTDYGNESSSSSSSSSTLVDWKFEMDPLEGLCEEYVVDYLGYVYKSCISRIHGAIEASSGHYN